jgi:hypothetical protein
MGADRAPQHGTVAPDFRLSISGFAMDASVGELLSS